MSDTPPTLPAPAVDLTMVTAEDQARLRTYWLTYNPNRGTIYPLTIWDNNATLWDDGATIWPT